MSEEFYSDIEFEISDVAEELASEAESVIESEITTEEEGSPEEQIRDWAEAKARDAVERGRAIDDWSTWIKGWKTPNATEKKMLFMYEYTRTYLEETGVDPRVADSVARGLAGMVFGRTDWAASLFDLEALKAIREDPRISEIYNQVHKDVRRFSDYYISMTPEELSTVADILAYGKAYGLSSKEVADKIVEAVPRLSPRSIYFNLYYISRVTGDSYIRGIAIEVSRLRRR
jgi:hypothetical protein